jgi:hypothetical protein
MEVELESWPRSRRPDRTTETTAARIIQVKVSSKGMGRTAPRPVFYYVSLSKAIQIHGRRVRSSIESGRTVEGIKATVVQTNT